MSSEFGQPELIRITPAPIDENLRKLEAKFIAEEVVRLQKIGRNAIINKNSKHYTRAKINTIRFF
ncbi:hypothetical protein QIA45_05210 (plasmid) [Borreliella andersonii]|uniref:Uncharacterized protein n=1 Tax=Borrelia andersonii TaxID=42109 RepID=A0ACD5G753_BORAD